MEPIDIDSLDPGVRKLVIFLRDHGFDTCDSGDGVSKPEAERWITCNHVFMSVDTDKMLTEATRLRDLVVAHGMKILTDDAQLECDDFAHIEVSWSPGDKLAVLSLFNAPSGWPLD